MIRRLAQHRVRIDQIRLVSVGFCKFANLTVSEQELAVVYTDTEMPVTAGFNYREKRLVKREVGLPKIDWHRRTYIYVLRCQSER